MLDMVLCGELMTLLDYVQWRNFENVVKKGMLSCKNNGIRVEDHFAGVSKMVTLGSGANREVEDYMLRGKMENQSLF